MLNHALMAKKSNRHLEKRACTKVESEHTFLTKKSILGEMSLSQDQVSPTNPLVGQKMFWGWLLLLCIGVIPSGQAQLAQWLTDLKSDAPEIRFDAAYELALYYRRTQQDSAQYFADLAGQLLPQLDSVQRVDAFSVQGLVAYEQADYDRALTFFAQAEREARQLGLIRQEVRSLIRQGNTYTQLGQLPEAVKHYQRAIMLAESANLERDRIIAIQSLAYGYQKTGYPGEALPYFEQALHYFEGTNDWPGIISTRNLIHVAWSNMDSLDRALDQLRYILSPPASLHLSAKDSATMLHNLGRLYNMREQYDAAQEALRQSLSIKESQNNPESYLKSLIEWMTSLKAQQRYREAANLVWTLDTTQITQSSKYTRRDFYRHWADILAGLDRYAEAYQYQKRYEVLDKDIFRAENTQAVADLELQLSRQKNQQLEQEKISARRQRNLAVALGVLGTLIVFLLARMRYQRRQQKLQLETLTAREREKQYADRITFFTNISHELRTPLTLIQGPIQELNQALAESSLSKYTDIILRNTATMNQLIDQTLDLARMNQMGQLPDQPLELRSFFQQIEESYRVRAQQKDLHVITNLRLPDPCWQLLPPQALQHIVHNLMSNAVKFTPNEGQVELQVDFPREAKEWTISVRDTGPGIHPDDLPHIFERFYQSHANLSNEKGSGIGLFLARSFAQQMGGSLSVESTLGKGTAFTCVLPAKWVSPPNEPYQAQIPAKPPAPTMVVPGTPTVLIVEDHPDLLTFLSDLLRTRYQILTAGNGAQAWQLLQKTTYRIDLIISDVMMPEMDGFTLLDQVKKQDHLADLPFILLTARTEPQAKLRALAAGVDDYLSKPFDREELLLRIQHLLDYRRQRMGLTTDNEQPGAEPAMTASDRTWLQKVEDKLREELSNPNFPVSAMARSFHLSERQFHRRIKALTGMTPNRYFREVKLNEARRMLEDGSFLTVSEVSFAIGIETPEYFTRLFRERFGRRPSDYLHHRNGNQGENTFPDS